MTARVQIYKPCEHCGEQFTVKGKQTVERHVLLPWLL